MWVDFEARKKKPTKYTWQEPNAQGTVVDWFEAVAFCRWYTHLDNTPVAGWEILLPTDEQWRQAYVGEGDQDFPWEGEPDPNKHANFTETCLDRTRPHFSPVGEMIAQRFGFTRNFLKERNTGCISY